MQTHFNKLELVPDCKLCLHDHKMFENIKRLLFFPKYFKYSIALRKKTGVYEFIESKLKDLDSQEYKSIIRIPTFINTYYVISNEDWINDILKHRRLGEGVIFGEGRQLLVIAEALGRYRISKNKEDSKQKRSIMAKLLSDSKRYLPSMIESTDKLVNLWNKKLNKEFSINSDISQFTLQQYLYSVFNYTDSVERIAEIVEQQINLLGQRLVYKYSPFKNFESEFKSLRSEMMELLFKDKGFLQNTEYKESLNDYINNHYSAIENDAFATGLNGAVLMGHLAPYPGFLMLVYELAKHPELQNLLRKEYQLHGNAEDAKLQYIQNDETLLNAFIHEVIRLHPSQPFVFRRTVVDTKFNNLTVRKGSEIILDIYHALRNRKIWGEDALEFCPQRFVENISLYKHVSLAYSSGPNNCSGQHYSRLSMKALILALIEKFRIESRSAEIKNTFHFALNFDSEIRILLTMI